MLESGHGLPSNCNEQDSPLAGGTFATTNPFTPDILVFDAHGNLIRGPLAKPTPQGGGFQPAGPAVDIAFENGFDGGRLFATASNQATHAAGQNNSSRIVIVDPVSGQVTPFIIGPPTGDHPTEQLAFKDGRIYWSQGLTTDSGVVGRDNGGGANRPDIPWNFRLLGNQRAFKNDDLPAMINERPAMLQGLEQARARKQLLTQQSAPLVQNEQTLADYVTAIERDGLTNFAGQQTQTTIGEVQRELARLSQMAPGERGDISLRLEDVARQLRNIESAIGSARSMKAQAEQTTR